MPSFPGIMLIWRVESVFFNECTMDQRKEQAGINGSQCFTPDSVQHEKCNFAVDFYKLIQNQGKFLLVKA